MHGELIPVPFNLNTLHKVYDKETYDDILKKNLGYKERALKFIEKKERAKDRQKAEAQAQLELDLEIEKGD